MGRNGQHQHVTESHRFFKIRKEAKISGQLHAGKEFDVLVLFPENLRVFRERGPDHDVVAAPEIHQRERRPPTTVSDHRYFYILRHIFSLRHLL